jgi:post-segregation antitoxin (ccd killing protein)
LPVEAAARIDAQRAELDASNEYTTRMQREAQAESEADWQAEAPDEIEMELQ